MVHITLRRYHCFATTPLMTRPCRTTTHILIKNFFRSSPISSTLHNFLLLLLFYPVQRFGDTILDNITRGFCTDSSFLPPILDLEQLQLACPSDLKTAPKIRAPSYFQPLNSGLERMDGTKDRRNGMWIR